MAQALYLYGVIEQEDISIDVEGVANAAHVYNLDYRTLSAVVSDIDTLQPEDTDENATAHNDVLTALLEYGGGRTVIPMQFGMACKNERTVTNILRGAYPAFRRAISEMDGAVELGLKVVEETPGVAERNGTADAIHESLRELSRESVTGDDFSDRLVLNRAYLVDREQQAAFGSAIEELEETYDDLLFHYTGPWAPFNFVDIQIGGRR